MDRLLLCDDCHHSATGHVATGCEVERCDCPVTRERIVETAIQLATEEIQRQYRGG